MSLSLSNARTPVRRLKRQSTLDAMTEALRELRLRQDCVTEDDLANAGFTRAEIAANGEAAKARVRRIELAAAA